jgi:hypothetical protein
MNTLALPTHAIKDDLKRPWFCVSEPRNLNNFFFGPEHPMTNHQSAQQSSCSNKVSNLNLPRSLANNGVNETVSGETYPLMLKQK